MPSWQQREGKGKGGGKEGLAYLISHRIEKGAEGRTEVHSSGKITIQPVSHCGKNKQTRTSRIAPGLNVIR